MRRMLALALAVLALAACGPDNKKVEIGPTTTSKNENTAELVFFLPRQLPADIAVERAVYNHSLSPDSEGWGAALGIPDGDGYRAAIHAIIATLSPDELAETGDPKGYDKVQVRGHAAFLNTSPVTGTVLMWRDDGRAVTLISGAEQRDTVKVAAEGLRVPPAGKTKQATFASLPPGYKLISEGGGDATGRRNDYSMHGAAPASTKSVSITVRTLPKGFAQPTVAFGIELHPRRVRGHPAWVGITTSVAGEQTYRQIHMVWRERTDLLVSIQGIVTEAEAVTIANGLERVSEAEWRKALDVEDIK